MLSGEDNAGERWKTTIGLISKKATLHVQHTFLYISLQLFCTTTTWNLLKPLSHTFYWGNVIRFLVHFFPHCRSFSSCIGDRWHFSFCHRRFRWKKIPTKKSLFHVFFISRSRSLSPYFSLSFAGLPPTLSYSLSFSCSIFQICGHDSYSELNTLENTDTETISPFRLFSCLCFTRRGWLYELHLGCHTCLLSYFTLVCLSCGRTVVRSVGVRSRDYQILLDG